MRRLASIGLLLAMTGCSYVGYPNDYVGNPLAGGGGFLADTHTFNRGPNRVQGDSDNIRRVSGENPTSDPLLPESGNVWPGPLPPDMTLGDIEKANGSGDVLKSGEQLNLGGTAPSPGNAPYSQKPVLVPNGNGTSLLIGPDGSVKTVPTPK
jgi:hypothetical protein